MAGRWLSAEELLRHASQQPSEVSLPQRSGVKDEMPDGSWLQQQKLDIFYSERREAIGEERIKKQGGLATGEWKPQWGKVQLTKIMGRFWKDMGHEENGVKFLYREEALLLMDEGQLEISYGGLPWSLQQAYAALLGPELPLEHYQVYSHLARLGYILHRFSSIEDITPYEQHMGLDKYRKKLEKKKQNKKRKAHSGAATGNEETPAEGKKLKTEDKHTGKDKNGGTSAEPCLPPMIDSGTLSPATGCKKVMAAEAQVPEHALLKGIAKETKCLKGVTEENAMLNLPEVMCTDCEVKKPRENAFDEVNCRNFAAVAAQHDCLPCRRWYSEPLKVHATHLSDEKAAPDLHLSSVLPSLEFPSIATVRKVDLPVPDKSLLPPGIFFNAQTYELPESENKSGLLEVLFSPRTENSLKRRTKNWKEYKECLSSQTVQEQLEDSAMGHLWQGDVKPLVSPLDAASSGSILDQLKIIQNVGQQDLSLPSSEVPEGLPSQPHYNVYQPNAKFAKTRPGLPTFRLVILRQQLPCGLLSHLAQMWKFCADQVPLHWAVVDHGDLAFYSFNPVDLPRDTEF